MAKVSFNFRQAMQPGGGQQEQLDEHALGAQQAALARNCQISDGAMRKIPGWMRLTGLSPTGYAMQTDGTNATGAEFDDHADYDLGKRWTIDVHFKATNLSAQHPIYWRADDSNNKITALECKTNGTFLFTHRDANDAEVTLTSSHSISAGGSAHIRVSRFKGELRMWVDGKISATDTGVDADYDTHASDNKWYVLVGTVTDGDDVTGVASAVGHIDEFRVWREEESMLPKGWEFTEYPYLEDERLVLLARFNETSGAVTDYSKNGNDGAVLASPTRNATALTTAIAPILKLWFLRTTAGLEQHVAWSNGGLYAVNVQ